MAFIRVQNLKIDDEGIVVSGTASICETIYDKNVQGSCKHAVREKLGKILYITKDHKEGIFLSQTRGLISYNVNKDEFSRVKENDTRLKETYDCPKPEVHKVFGDVFLILELLKKTHLLEVLHEVFPEEGVFISVIIHAIHTILKDRSSIELVDFVSKSFLSYIVENPDSILEEKALFEKLGGYEKREEDIIPISNKRRFFETLIKTMKKHYPSFGESCFVQEVTLQSIDIYNPYPNMTNSQKEHIYYQNKVLMIIDQDTGIPVWYEIVNWRDPWKAYYEINGNAGIHGCSVNTLKYDSTYYDPRLFHSFFSSNSKINEGGETVIVWVPEQEPKQFRKIRKKNPSELGKHPYEQVFDWLKTGESVTFRRYSHRIDAFKRKLDTFMKDLDTPLFIYTFTDHDLCVKCFSLWSAQKNNISKAEIEVEHWKIGGIVLLSNKSCKPEEIFDEYFRWNKQEEAFRQYLDTDKIETTYIKDNSNMETGKILLACICLIMRQLLVDQLKKNRELILTHIIDDRIRYKKESALSKLDEEVLYDEVIHRVFGKLQSLMCFERNGRVIIETPNNEVKHIFNDLGIQISSSINIDTYVSSLAGKRTRLYQGRRSK